MLVTQDPISDISGAMQRRRGIRIDHLDGPLLSCLQPVELASCWKRGEPEAGFHRRFVADLWKLLPIDSQL